jgi:hypothetical protein
MKRYFLFLLIPVFLGCGRAAEKKAQELQSKTDSLLSQTMQKDEAINEFIRSINDIQGTLDTIKQKENIINLTTDRGGELKLSAKDQIKNDNHLWFDAEKQRDHQRPFKKVEKFKHEG